MTEFKIGDRVRLSHGELERRNLSVWTSPTGTIAGFYTTGALEGAVDVVWDVYPSNFRIAYMSGVSSRSKTRKSSPSLGSL